MRSPAQDSLIVVTDSQAACRHYAAGRIASTALRIIQSLPTPPDIYILWTPGHASLEGNEAAHAAAREHTYRAFPIPASPQPPEDDLFIPRTHKDLLNHHRLTRRTLPPPHDKLTKEDATTYRRIQTNTYPHGTLLHAIHPTSYAATCKFCPQSCPPPHDLGVLSYPVPTPIRTPTPEQWESMLASSDPHDELHLVKRARLAATAQGLLD